MRIKNNNMVCQIGENSPRIEPIVYTGMQDKYATIYFNNYFEYESIYNLIVDIDNVRQSGSYNKLNLYFTSDGGQSDCLFTLADYLNQIDDIEIDFVVSGMVASAGFYILLMMENDNINIIFNNGSSGLIHLGDTWVSLRGSLSKESDRYDWNKFVEKDLKRLNKYFKETYLNKLNLTKEDRKRLNQGQDVYLSKDDLEEIVYSFHEKRYYESENFISTYNQLKEKRKSIDDLIDNMKKEYKKCVGKDLTD